MPLICLSQDTLKFAMPHYPPYTLHESKGLGGFGYQAVLQVVKGAGYDLDVIKVPNYGRALRALQTGKADGMFLASRNNERDEVAIMTKRISYSNWSWVTLNDWKSLDLTSEVFKQEAIIAAPINTNIHKWLLANKFNVLSGSSKIDFLFKLINTKRATAMMLPEVSVYSYIKEYNIDEKRYQIEVAQRRPFGIYIHKETAKKYPELITRLNQQIEKVLKNKPDLLEPMKLL